MIDLDRIPQKLRPLLGRRIRSLGLEIAGSPVEPHVRRLRRELRQRGLERFRPAFYLTDQWGCPDREPAIGIPFYLADERLSRIEEVMDDLEDEREIMKYLRHEAGHAFNYAYRLFETAEWRKRFGPFHRRYRDHYRPVPFSRRFVRHLEGWYAQKHPDEDFAETFAVWLTPRTDWRRRYAGWPALDKLRYVERIAKKLGGREPRVRSAELDLEAHEMNRTIDQHYRRLHRESRVAIANAGVERDLADLFPAPPRGVRTRPATDLIDAHRGVLVDKITYWSGVRRAVVRAIVERMAQGCREQELVAGPKEEAYLIELTVYGTALATSYLARGRFG